jgi:sec-independent protein translocase protein TatA
MINLLIIGGIIGMNELLVILAVALLLFGGRKIPELMRGLGKGVSEFKKGMKGEDDDANKSSAKEEQK